VSAVASGIKNKGFPEAFSEDVLAGGGLGVALGALSFAAASGIIGGSLTSVPIWRILLAGTFTPGLAALYEVAGREIAAEVKKLEGELGL
jgi:hypothetical protein